jgi:hypothetical protein
MPSSARAFTEKLTRRINAINTFFIVIFLKDAAKLRQEEN